MKTELDDNTLNAIVWVCVTAMVLGIVAAVYSYNTTTTVMALKEGYVRGSLPGVNGSEWVKPQPAK